MGIMDGAKSTISLNSVVIPGVTSITPVSITRERIDVTAKGDALKKSRPSSQPSAGEISFSGNLDLSNAAHQGLLAMYANQDPIAAVVTEYVRTGSTLSAYTITISEGYLADLSYEDSSVDGNITFSAVFVCNALPVVAPVVVED